MNKAVHWSEGGTANAPCRVGAPLHRNWVEGWSRDRSERPVRDPRGNAEPACGYREQWVAGDAAKWKEHHQARMRTVRVLRRAGYVARHNWEREYRGKKRIGTHEIDNWVYSSGPAEGARAVDPWDVARRMDACASDWAATPYLQSSGAVQLQAAAKTCGQRLTCPVCAAKWSRRRAAALRALWDEERVYVHVTLTQRADQSEALTSALGRWRSAWRLLQSGRNGQWWRRNISAHALGLECGPKSASQQRWHVHGHIVLELQPGVPPARVKQWLLNHWKSATNTAREGWGFDPISAKGGGWWRPINHEGGLYQACKYATPVLKLRPRMAAEWVAASSGRRWAEFGGRWRGRAAERDETRGVPLAQPGRSPSAPQMVDRHRLEEKHAELMQEGLYEEASRLAKSHSRRVKEQRGGHYKSSKRHEVYELEEARQVVAWPLLHKADLAAAQRWAESQGGWMHADPAQPGDPLPPQLSWQGCDLVDKRTGEVLPYESPVRITVRISVPVTQAVRELGRWAALLQAETAD